MMSKNVMLLHQSTTAGQIPSVWNYLDRSDVIVLLGMNSIISWEHVLISFNAERILAAIMHNVKKHSVFLGLSASVTLAMSGLGTESIAQTFWNVVVKMHALQIPFVQKQKVALIAVA